MEQCTICFVSAIQFACMSFLLLQYSHLMFCHSQFTVLYCNVLSCIVLLYQLKLGPISINISLQIPLNANQSVPNCSLLYCNVLYVLYFSDLYGAVLKYNVTYADMVVWHVLCARCVLSHFTAQAHFQPSLLQLETAPNLESIILYFPGGRWRMGGGAMQRC